jgi:hypothetical protein
VTANAAPTASLPAVPLARPFVVAVFIPVSPVETTMTRADLFHAKNAEQIQIELIANKYKNRTGLFSRC